MNDNRNLVVITGASMGFGKAIATSFAEQFPVTDFLFIGRSEDKMLQTSQEVKLITDSTSQVFITVADLSNLENLDNKINDALNQIDPKRYKRFFLVHNSGSVGQVNLLSKLESLSELNQAINLNCTSVVWLTKRFLERVTVAVDSASSDSTTSNERPIVIVNVSSLCAVKPFDGLGVYCSGKAFRDMLMGVVAQEGKLYSPHVTTLNYAPGPLKTDMQLDLTSSQYGPIRETFTNLREKGVLIDPQVSAKKLIELLVSNNFENGAHVDIYSLM